MKNRIAKTLIFSLIKLLIFLNIAFADKTNLTQVTLGDDKAQIIIKEYFSLTCSHCANFHNNTFPEIKKKLIDTGKVKFEFIDYPLDRLAMIAATVARSLPKESYIETVDVLLSNQERWAYSKDPLTELLKLSKLFGITEKQFDKILSDRNLMQNILNKMEEENSKHNIESTPTFVINEKYVISGSFKYEELLKKLKDLQLLD
ncbi:MAG: hypothetical protein CMN44_03775 [SAR116 cluster bacterium]|nr:hypothetical protein [SAR116 cluster bacterium]RPH10845.1 MAG: hypothetical protein CBC14_003725 [Alphaproteobacteria bacterium TMED54]|tara:strand:+ start:2164 stop:2772 length:609 start_codon:yes stop_codon:yes gene_type:complete